MNPRPALQRSAMFPAMLRATPPYVSLLWSEEESSVSRAFYKHYVPTGRQNQDYHPSEVRRLTRDPKVKGVYSPTGIFVDATLATRAKGEKITKALVDGILKEIEDLRQSPATEQPRQ